VRILVTGAAGFIGHHVASRLQALGDVTALVRTNRIGDVRRLEQIGFKGRIVWHDLRSPLPFHFLDMDYVVHLGAETHVDRSITDPLDFVSSNVLGTVNLLEWSRERCRGKYLQFSTDEVFGPAPEGVWFGETDAHNPKNPYAASKSAAEAMVKSYENTFGLNAAIVRGMNVFGERQHREKFIPLAIRSILEGKKIKVHANKDRTRAGSRCYVHVDNVCSAIEHVLFTDHPGPFHIAGEEEVPNDRLVEQIGAILDKKPIYELVDFHSSRPGHDLRYALANVNLKDSGWKPLIGFSPALEKTVRWYVENPEWL
jgi:dTDP-glucose 4,6-dehydratase